MEADSELDREDAWKGLIGDGLVDETVHEHTHPLDWLNGQENGRVNVERAWSFGIGGDEPIEVDPHEVPDHGINVVG